MITPITNYINGAPTSRIHEDGAALKQRSLIQNSGRIGENCQLHSTIWFIGVIKQTRRTT